MCNRRLNIGFTLISILIGLFILASAIIVLVKAYPVIMKMSEKSKNFINVSFIGDKILSQIEEIYGNKEIPLPETLIGIVDEFPDYKYKLNFIKEKDDLYRIELEIFWKREGKDEKKYFVSVLRRR
ncbi:MAG: hypothetical protein NC915_05520 [Candidatus Omnitrophica bacterium]|nr:hypothetical protein [Candidatus Omnitrophota bacterium]